MDVHYKALEKIPQITALYLKKDDGGHKLLLALSGLSPLLDELCMPTNRMQSTK